MGNKTNEKKVRYYLKDFTTETPNLTVTRKVLSGKHKLHCHNFFEIELIISGNGTQYLNGTPYTVKQGNFYLLTTADFHEIEFTEPAEIINVSFDPSVLPQAVTKKLTEVITDKNYCLSSDEYDRYYSILNALLYEYDNSFTMRNDAVFNLLQYVVIFFLRKVNFSENKKEPNNNFETALTYINIHFKENPKLREVAKRAHYNPAYFSQLFKECVGVKYIDYVNSLKINQAKRLLSSTDNSVTDIGFMCGFNSTSNFFLAFKNATGVSPYKYRNNTKTNLT